MNTPPSPSATPPAATSDFERWHWGKSLGAAVWPLFCALAYAGYAFWPERFPEGTGVTLAVLAAAELPLIFVGMLHAAALREPTVKERLRAFLIGVTVFGVISLIHLGFNVGFRTLLPVVFWILLPLAIDLCFQHRDRMLASRQIEATLQDRLHMIALVPVIVAGSLALAIATVVVLMLVSITTGGDLLCTLDVAADRLKLSLLALVPAAYLLVASFSAAHVHRPQFIRTRRRLLERPWLVKLTARGNKRVGRR
jgi:hypothetical protein